MTPPQDAPRHAIGGYARRIKDDRPLQIGGPCNQHWPEWNLSRSPDSPLHKDRSAVQNKGPADLAEAGDTDAIVNTQPRATPLRALRLLKHSSPIRPSTND